MNREVNKVTVHCDALIVTQDQKELNHYYENYIKLNPEEIELLQGLIKPTDIWKVFWEDIKGWKNPGYHRFVNTDGVTENLQEFNKPSNGVSGHNLDSIHICYNGGVELVNGKYFEIDTRTNQQILGIYDSVVDAMVWADKQLFVAGHNYYDKGKACPCFDAKEELDFIKYIDHG